MTPERARIVLVVEDDPGLRQLYRDALTRGGFAVVAVEDGVDALRFIEQHPPAAVVLDLGLPRLHGRDVQRELSAQGYTATVPVIVVTGEPEGIDENDVACVVRKPFDPEDLVDIVRKCLAGAAKKRQFLL